MAKLFMGMLKLSNPSPEETSGPSSSRHVGDVGWQGGLANAGRVSVADKIPCRAEPVLGSFFEYKILTDPFSPIL
jgi:hypothetical protein